MERLGCLEVGWAGNWQEDVRQRLKRGGKSWITKRLQAKIVEMSVESSLLFDCQARTWKVKDVKQMQSLVDRAYRYIWSDRKQAERVNMVDVRNALGVKSLRWKIEKRIYERMGHVLRMEDGRLVKLIVFGWLKRLEESGKMKGQRKTF